MTHSPLSPAPASDLGHQVPVKTTLGPRDLARKMGGVGVPTFLPKTTCPPAGRRFTAGTVEPRPGSMPPPPRARRGALRRKAGTSRLHSTGPTVTPTARAHPTPGPRRDSPGTPGLAGITVTASPSPSQPGPSGHSRRRSAGSGRPGRGPAPAGNPGPAARGRSAGSSRPGAFPGRHCRGRRRRHCGTSPPGRRSSPSPGRRTRSPSAPEPEREPGPQDSDQALGCRALGCKRGLSGTEPQSEAVPCRP